MPTKTAMRYDKQVQEIKIPRGGRMYILSEEEYLRLMEIAENRADTKAVHIFQKKLAAGEEEMIPAEIASRLIDGENPIKVWREYRGFSVKLLAERVGISSSYLSQIEGGTKNGTVDTYKKFAKILCLTVDDLI